ncbi:MAG: phosphoribosylformylglycinamidine synthase subunit PurS [Gemmatimonadaceae bacterium]|nr:phosphoribosylformylglycinamidine synthase subunit PurS [Gemmatimonadaceae bacterium]
MPRFSVSIHIVPRKGLLDPQGKAVADALHALGFATVADARIGRHIVLEVDGESAEAARAQATAMCDKLLANPVTEDYEIAAVAGG